MPKRKYKRGPKPSPEVENGIDTVNGEVSTEPPESRESPTINLKLCRLCESKGGPFLHIFATEKVAKQIGNVLPFEITKTDGLPQTVCFRCVAKVDELHEFIEKCIKTRDNLVVMFGNASRSHPKTKSKERLCWEEKLVAENKSHEDICDEVVKRAMQAVINTPAVNPNTVSTSNGDTLHQKKNLSSNKQCSIVPTLKRQDQEVEDQPLSVRVLKRKQSNETSYVTRPQTLRTSSRTERNYVSLPKEDTPEDSTKLQPQRKQVSGPASKRSNTAASNDAPVASTSASALDCFNDTTTDDEESDENDIMFVKDEIDNKIDSMPFLNTMRVYGVGLLYKCNLCNRNFLNKHIVVAHSCVKNSEKSEVQEKAPTAENEVRKPHKVKYISTLNNNSEEIHSEPTAAKRPKPKVGPASKTGRRPVPIPASVSNNTGNSVSNNTENSVSNNNKKGKEQTKVSVPTMTPAQLNDYNDKGSYVLVPRPGNKFILERKKDVGTENVLKQKTHTKTSATQKPQTVTTATSSGSSSNNPYPVALFHVKNATDGTASGTNVTPEVSVQPSKYSCNICNKQFSRHPALITHLQFHYQKEIEKPKPKRSRKN